MGNVRFHWLILKISSCVNRYQITIRQYFRLNRVYLFRRHKFWSYWNIFKSIIYYRQFCLTSKHTEYIKIDIKWPSSFSPKSGDPFSSFPTPRFSSCCGFSPSWSGNDGDCQLGNEGSSSNNTMNNLKYRPIA